MVHTTLSRHVSQDSQRLSVRPVMPDGALLTDAFSLLRHACGAADAKVLNATDLSKGDTFHEAQLLSQV
jgi:hypothetical protein